MDHDHPRFEDAEFTVTVRPVPPRISGTAVVWFRPLNKKLLEEVTLESWTVARIQCDEGWKDMLYLLGCKVGVALDISTRKATLQITLLESARTAISEID